MPAMQTTEIVVVMVGAGVAVFSLIGGAVVIGAGLVIYAVGLRHPDW